MPVMKKLFALAVLSACIPALASAQEGTAMKEAAVDETLKILDEAAQAVESAPRVEQQTTPAPKYWKTSLMTKIDFGQTSLTNWAAGGYNTVTLKSFIDANADYEKDAMFWKNRLQLDYGFLYSADKPVLQKSDDRIYLESKWGYQAKNSLYYSAEFSFKSQFSNTREFPTPGAKADGSALGENEEYTSEDWMAASVLKSGFMSPAYTNLALGLDYKPLNWLTVNFAPVTGGLVVVDNPLLRKSYSMPLKREFEDVTLSDEEMNAGNCYKSVRFEFGAQLKVDFKVNVNDNFSYTSQVVLFSDYLDKPQNIRVNWDNRIDWKLTKFFSLTFTTNLIYDDKVMIKNDKDIDKYPDGKQRVQFKESMAFGFVYTFSRGN